MNRYYNYCQSKYIYIRKSLDVKINNIVFCEILNLKIQNKLNSKLVNSSILNFVEFIYKDLNLLKTFIFDIKQHVNNTLLKNIIVKVYEKKEDFLLISVLRIINDDLKVDFKNLDLSDSIFKSALNFIMNVSNNRYIKPYYY